MRTSTESEARRAWRARYRASEKGRATEKAYSDRYRREHPEVYRRAAFKLYHGVERDEADRMIAAQGGLCAICCREPSKIYRGHCSRLHVDHDHRTGKVRGMLCIACNRALGCARDDPKVLEAMAAYLRKHQEPA